MSRGLGDVYKRQAKEAVLASKGAYIDVSDRRMQVQLTQEAKIASDFFGQYPVQRTGK